MARPTAFGEVQGPALRTPHPGNRSSPVGSHSRMRWRCRRRRGLGRARSPSRCPWWWRCGRGRAGWRRCGRRCRRGGARWPRNGVCRGSAAGHAGGGTEAFPAAGDQLRPPRPPARGVVGEHQVGRVDGPAVVSSSLFGSGPVLDQGVRRLGGDRDASDPSGLRRLDHEPGGPRSGHGAFDADGVLVEVDVGPPQPADLTSSGAGGSGHLEPAREGGVAAFSPGQHGADLDGVGWGDGGAWDSGRVAFATGLRGSHPQRTAWANARWRTTWAQRTRDGPTPAAAIAV